jgi:hypothetical protein
MIFNSEKSQKNVQYIYFLILFSIIFCSSKNVNFYIIYIITT